MKMLTILVALAAAVLTGCGGGDDAARHSAPSIEYHRAPCPSCAAHVAVWLDAATDEDIAEAQAMPYLWTVEPHGLLVGSTSPNEAAVRLWVIDVVATEFIALRVMR